MRILGIETSCDETSAAVVEDGAGILSNVVASQADLHARWGGVVPEVASRKHVEQVLPVIHEALDAARTALPDIDGIAVTNRPGLVGALIVGVSAAKALAYALRKPIAAVHHLEGHLYSAFLADPALQFPFVALIVSGGHTELVLARDHGRIESMGRTRDDAAGECFDKCARLLGLPYPGGPSVDRAAESGDPRAVPFPRAWLPNTLDFSFSGLKTAVRRFLEADQGRTALPDVCASFQESIVEVLVSKSVRAARAAGVPALAAVGGVAANRRLEQRLRQACDEAGLRLVSPPPLLCTDNAAMIAAAAYPRLSRGEGDPLTFDTMAAAPLAAVPKTADPSGT